MTIGQSTHQRFRVECEWRGGGFGFTLPFANEAAAMAWARRKSKAHPEAVVTVDRRDDDAHALAAMFAGSRPDLVLDVDALRRAALL